MTVTQNQQRMVANWDSCSIGSNASVHYQQPAGGVALNRVTGTAPSEIYGRLSATGSVFLLNPNGVMFGPGASVNVGALVATTMKMNDADFMAGNYKFTGGNGSVINQGNLTAEQGGYIALLAPEVRNEGLITASMGSVLLAGAEAVTLSHDSTGLQYAVDKGAVQALVENKHLIQADGGQVILTARAANQLASAVINNSGTIEAKGLSSKGGRIVLEADHITLKTGSTLDASGDTGGGTVLVGGDWQGSGAMQQAVTVNMENGAKIDVSAKTTGEGGKAVLWSDVNKEGGVTRADGVILAKGGVDGGDGGKVEISGHFLQLGENLSVDTQATNGANGLLLLDPKNIVISNSNPGGTIDISSYSTTDGTLWNNLANSGYNYASTVWTTPASIVNLLNQTNVYLQAGNDITIGSAINASGNTLNSSLSMQAGRSIQINADITLRGAFTATSNYYTIAQNSARDAGAGSFTMGTGTTISTNGGGAASVAKSIDIKVSKDGETAGTASIQNLVAGSATGASKDITILADTITLAGGANSIQGNGAVTLAPVTATRNIIVGGTGSGSELLIDATTLAALKAGFSAINIGDNTGGTRDNPDVAMSNTITVAGSTTAASLVNFFGGTFTQDSGTVITAPGIGIYADTMNLNGGANSLASTGTLAFGPGTFTKTSIIGATGTAGQWSFDAAKWTTVQGVAASGYTGLNLGAPALNLLTSSGSTSLAGTLATSVPLTITGRDVTVDAAYTWSDASALTLNANRNITINATITASHANGKLVLNYGQSDTAANVTSNPDYYGNYFLGSSGKVNLQPGLNFDTKAGYDGTVKQWRVINSLGAAGDVTSGALTLQGMAASANLATNFVLGTDIDASATSSSWGSAGWTPIGTSSTAFSGNFDGLGHNITGLYINNTSSFSGLFGYAASNYFGNVGLVNANITSTQGQVGALAGYVQSAGTSPLNINRVYATGSVSSSGGTVGGLLGGLYNGNAGIYLKNSHTDMTVTNTGTGTEFGGLIGGVTTSSISITDSYTRGNVVSGKDSAGGLLGRGTAVSIARSYSLGNVGKFSDANGTPDATAQGWGVGGLVGKTFGYSTITDSYSKGHVAGAYNVGGLLGGEEGPNQTTITRSYTTGNIKNPSGGGGQRVGGLIGYGYNIYLYDNYTLGDIRADWADAGGLVGSANQSIYFYNGNYVAGTVYAPATGYNGSLQKYGAFWGNQPQASPWISGTVTAAYYQIGQPVGYWDWNTFLNWANVSIGNNTQARIAYSLANMKDQSYYVQGANKFDFTTTWAIDPGINNGMPYLRANVPLTFVTITLPSYAMTYGDAVPTISSAWSATGGTSYISALNWGTSVGTKPNWGTYTYGTDSNIFSISYASGTTAANYSISYSGNSLTVDKKPLTITAPQVTKIYDGTTVATGTSTYGTLATGDSVTTAATLTFDNRNFGAGGKTVTPSAVVIKDGSTDETANYLITYTPNAASTINKLALTVTAPDLTKTYDGGLSATGTATFSSSLGSGAAAFGAGDSITTNPTLAFTNKNFGINDRTVATSGLVINDGNSGNNYTISYTDNTTSTINKANLTLTTSNVIKTYDKTTTAAGTASVSSGTLFTGDTITGGSFAFTDVNFGAGNKTVTVGSVTVNDGNSGNNYNVSYANNTTSTINKAGIVFTTSDVTKTYDGLLTAAGITAISSGTLFGGDTFSGGTFAFLDKNFGLGNKSVSTSGVTVNDGNSGLNYSVTYANNTTSTINKLALTVTAPDLTKTYDGGLTQGDATGSAVVGSLVAGDSVNATATLAYLDKNYGVDNKTVRASALTIKDGASANMTGNYAITYVDNTTSGINRKDVSVTSLEIADKVYDGTTNASSVQSTVLSGVVLADAANVNTTGTLANFSGKNVGTYSVSVTGLSLTGSEANNYNLTGGTTATDASVAITKKTVSLSASKVYDGSTDLTGFVTLGTGVGSETLTYSGATASDKHVATAGKFINVITLGDEAGATSTSGGLASNYQLPTLNAANSAVTLSARPIDITADAKSKIYGNADPALTYTPEASGTNRGLITGDTFTGSLTRVAGETVSGGPYAISQGTTLANSDYAINFIGNTLTINQRPVTLTATTASRIYGDSAESLAVTASASGAGVGLATSGNGNTVNDTLADVTGTVGRQAGNNVGAYDITLGTGSKASNYAITFTTDNNAFTINRRPVNVTADAKTKVYGDTDPTWTYTTNSGTVGSGAGLMSGDSLSGTLTRVTGETSGPGGVTYQIQQGTVTNTANGNYDISYGPANLNITQKNLTLAGNTGVTKTYDGTTAMPLGNFGYGSLVGIVGSDTVTVSGAPVYDSANANAVRTVLIGNIGIAGVDANNYTMSWTNGSGTINKAPLSVTANADAKFVTQGDVLTSYNGVSYNGFVHGENTSALNISGLSIDRNNSSQNNAGTYSGVLVPSGVTAGNYQISYVNGDYTIVPANQLLVRVQNTSTTYGTGPSYTITDARYMDGSNVIHTLAAPTISGNTATYSDGVGGSATFTLGPVAAQNSTANWLKAGGYAIGASNVTESSANFSNTLTVTGALTVDKKALSANASNVSKVYDGTTAMNNVVLGYTGLETNDVVTISGNGNFADKNVGAAKTYTVSSLTLGSTDAANYFLSGGTSLSGSNGEVTRKTVSLAAARTYDGTTTLGNGTVTITTGVGSETLTYSGATAHSKNAGAGNYIDAITLSDEVGATSTSGGLASNYQLPTMTANGTQNSVNFAQKALSISGITAADKTYDGNAIATVNTNNASYSGLVGGDQFSVSATGLFDTKNSGTNKTVALTSTYSGSDVGNYAVTGQPTTTANVSRKALTVSGTTAANKTYDGTTSATLTLGSLLGLISGESLGLSGIGDFADPNVGIGKAVAVKLALADGANGLAANYSISNTSTTANINPVPNVVPPLPPPIPPAPPAPPFVPPMPDPMPVPDPTPGPGIPTGVPGGPGGVPSEPLGPSGPSGPSSDPSQPSGPNSPSGDPSQPSGPNSPSGDPSQPSGPNSPSGNPSQPSGPNSPSGDPSQPSGPSGTSGDSSQPSGPNSPSGDPAKDAGTPGGGTQSSDALKGLTNGETPTQLSLTPVGDAPANATSGSGNTSGGPSSSAGDTSSSSTGAGEQGASGGFISVRTFGSMDVPAGSLFSFTIPKDTFKHADPKASVTLDARNADGGPLPDWLIFEPGLGRFTGRPPEGLRSFNVLVIGRDGSGNEAYTKVTLNFGQVKK
jgi:filamentous hemagglutinin family protein